MRGVVNNEGVWSVAKYVPIDIHEEEETAEEDGSNECPLQTSKVDSSSNGQASQVGVSPIQEVGGVR